MDETKFKCPYWILMVNGGDGSALPMFFTSRERAEAYAVGTAYLRGRQHAGICLTPDPRPR